MIVLHLPRRLTSGEHRTVAMLGNPEMHLQRQMEQKDFGQEGQKKAVESHVKLSEEKLAEQIAARLKGFESGTQAHAKHLTDIQNRVGRTQKIAAMQHPDIGVAPVQTQQVKYETKAQFESRQRANTVADALTGGSLLSSESTETRAHGPEVRTVNAPGAVNTGGERQATAVPGAAAQPGAKIAVESGEKKAAQQKIVAETGVPEAQTRRTA